MANRLTPGLATPSVRFFALRSDAPASITHTEPGISIGWRRSLDGAPLAGTFTTLSIASLLTLTDPHGAGGLIVVDAATGEHRLDLPSAAAATGADAVDLEASATDTNLVFVVPPITIDTDNQAVVSKSLMIHEGTIDGVSTATNVYLEAALTYADTELDDYLLIIRDVSTGEEHSRWINKWTGAGQNYATVDALPFTPANGVDTYRVYGILKITAVNTAPTAIVPVMRQHRVGDPSPITVAAFVGADFSHPFKFAGDLTAETFTFAVESSPDRLDIVADLAPVATYDAAKDQTTITPTIDKANHTAEAIHSYALRHVSGTNAPIARGDYVIAYAPDNP